MKWFTRRLQFSDIPYEEFEPVDDYELRLLPWPYREVGVRFSNARVSRVPASPEDRAGAERQRDTGDS